MDNGKIIKKKDGEYIVIKSGVYFRGDWKGNKQNGFGVDKCQEELFFWRL